MLPCNRQSGKKTEKDADSIAPSLRIVRHPRHLRPGFQPGEVRVRHLVAGFSGSPHLRHRYRPPPGQRPGHFILTIINPHNVCICGTLSGRNI